MEMRKEDFERAISIVKERFFSEDCEIYYENMNSEDGIPLDIYMPRENTGFNFNIASNDDVISCIMYFKDADEYPAYKKIHTYVERYVDDMSIFDFFDEFENMIDEMSISLEKAVEKEFRRISED